MSKITAIRTGKNRKRTNIFLDGKPMLGLDATTVGKEGLHIEQELSTNQVEELVKADQSQRCLSTAIRYINHRPRSESEIRGKLTQRGFASDSIEGVITKLKAEKLIDDTAFARFWKDNRESFSPRSQYLTKLELRRKGVAKDIIDEVASTIDEDDSAYRAALGKASRLAHTTDYPDFRRRLGEYLKRRGFSYGVIIHTVERLWKERENEGVETDNSN